MPPITDIVRKKTYPLDYSDEVLQIIKDISFTDGKDVNVVGSMSIRSQQYAGDYDLEESINVKYKSVATAVKYYIKRFQSIIKTLLDKKGFYIGDIKAGFIKEWDVLDGVYVKGKSVIGWNTSVILGKLANMLDANVITEEEYELCKDLVSVQKPTLKEYFEAKEAIKFSTVRWTPKEILDGYCTLRDGRKYTLSEALSSPARFKLDAVAYVENSRFTDFSIIYKLYNNNVLINDDKTGRELEALKEDILSFFVQENYFKMAKRLFSLSRIQDNKKLISQLNTIMNGDLGRLYSIISDINTLLDLLENHSLISVEKIDYELDRMRARLSNVYTVKQIRLPKFTEELVAMVKIPNTSSGKSTLKNKLESFKDELSDILSAEAKKELISAKVLPLSPKYYP